jgi:hypothetical protein
MPNAAAATGRKEANIISKISRFISYPITSSELFAALFSDPRHYELDLLFHNNQFLPTFSLCVAAKAQTLVPLRISILSSRPNLESAQTAIRWLSLRG